MRAEAWNARIHAFAGTAHVGDGMHVSRIRCRMMADLEERSVLWVRGVPDRDAAPGNSALWLEQTVRDAQQSGGRVELTLGLTVVITFDGIEIEHAVELARQIVADATQASPHISVHIGIALGEVERRAEAEYAAFVGSAFDRAQVLSQRARAGEIAFDEPAEQRGEDRWLFAREIFAERVRGHVLEPVHWSRRVCRAALARLKPAPLPESALPVFDQLRELAQRPGQQRIVIHSSAKSAGIDCIERLLASRAPSLRLDVTATSGALRPLGSLALALLRVWPDADALARASLPDELRVTIDALCAGRPVARAEAAAMLTTLLTPVAGEADRPCIVLDELNEIDPATLGVIAEALMAPELDALVLMALPLDASVPTQLLPAADLHELYLPPLPPDDRIAVAEAVLGLESGSEIAQRVAMLGGNSAQGVIEAIRTLVSSGDLVLRDERFGWRVGPRQGATTVPVEALITERVVGLAPSAYRVLEVLCSCPRQAPRALIHGVAQRDGMNASDFAAGLAPLVREGFVDASLALGPSDQLLRGALRNLMPPARAAELHRFVADYLRANVEPNSFASAEIAFHLAEGGQTSEAASALVEAAHAALESGFQRIALRLLATAVEWEPSTQIRRAASELARVVANPAHPNSEAPAGAAEAAKPVPWDSDIEQLADDEFEELKSEDLQLPSSMAKGAMRSALAALDAGDFETMERWLDAAVAAGGGRAAAQRVLALSHLLRGDVTDAVHALQRGSPGEPTPGVRARDSLAWSLVRLAVGDCEAALRAGFAALALCRQHADVRGEAAALRVLALGYRSLDRDDDANQLEATAELLVSAPAQAPDLRSHHA